MGGDPSPARLPVDEEVDEWQKLCTTSASKLPSGTRNDTILDLIDVDGSHFPPFLPRILVESLLDGKTPTLS